MRHRKKTVKLNRNGSHRRALFANMLKSLITHGRVETTLPKAKALRFHAERVITYAKKKDLAGNRLAMQKLMLRFNALTPKQRKAAKEGNKSAFNDDRMVMEKLTALAGRFESRPGGYTRIVKKAWRSGDNAPLCLIEYVE